MVTVGSNRFSFGNRRSKVATSNWHFGLDILLPSLPSPLVLCFVSIVTNVTSNWYFGLDILLSSFFFLLKRHEPREQSSLNPAWCEATYWWLTNNCSPHHLLPLLPVMKNRFQGNLFGHYNMTVLIWVASDFNFSTPAGFALSIVAW